MTGLRAFREAFLSADVQDPDDWQDFDGRQTRYDLLWSLYENTAYRSIHSWATAYKSTFGLYKYARNLYNPAYRLGEFWKTHIWGGALDLDAGPSRRPAHRRPLRAAAQGHRPDLDLVQLDRSRRTSAPCGAAVLGDVAIKVVDDTDRHKTYLELVHPATLADVQLDPFGHVKAYTIQETRAHPNNPNQEVTYSETAERGAGEEVIFRTYLNNQPWPWNGAAAEWVEPYGFIPLVVVQHNNVGLDWGWSELHPALAKIREVDDLASLLTDQIRDHRQGPLALHRLRQGPQSPPGRPAATRTDDIPEPGREEMLILYAKDPATKAQALIADLDIAGVLAHIEALLRELERDYPELRFDNLRLTGTVSGRTLQVARQPVETKVLQRRALYDDALVRAQNMAVAIAGYRRQVDGFDLASYARGQLDHSIGSRPVFDVAQADRDEEEAAFWTNAGLAVDAGVPLEIYLRRHGWHEHTIQAIKRARAARSKRTAAAIGARNRRRRAGRGAPNDRPPPLAWRPSPCWPAHPEPQLRSPGRQPRPCSGPTAPPATSSRGPATYYSPDLMESVARSRGYSLEGTAGGVAMNRRGDLGRLVWLDWYNPVTKRAEITGPYRVVDCARQGRDYAARERSGRIVEVSFQLAQAWAIAGVGPTPVRVWLVDPHRRPTGFAEPVRVFRTRSPKHQKEAF